MSCVHCVVTRAAARLGQRHARPVTLSSYSPHPPVVAMRGADLYALVSHFLGEAAASSPPETPLRVRIVADTHPEIQILVASGAARSPQMRKLRVPRHAEGSLALGFEETYGGH